MHMKRQKSKRVTFSKATAMSGRKREVVFEPCDAAKQLRKSNYSDLNELKSYLRPRGVR